MLYDTYDLKKILQKVYDNTTDTKKRCHIIDFEDYQKRPDSVLIANALENLILTYGEETVKRVVKRKLKLINSKRKAA